MPLVLLSHRGTVVNGLNNKASFDLPVNTHIVLELKTFDFLVSTYLPVKMCEKPMH